MPKEPGIGKALLAPWTTVKCGLVVGRGSQVLLLEVWVVL